MTDNAIIALFFNRDGDALREIENKYGKVLKHYAEKCLSDKRDSEEVYMDALNDAWTTIPPQKPDSLGAYMMTLLKNRTFNRIKYLSREKRAKNREDIYSDFNDLPFEPSAEDTMINNSANTINDFLKTETQTNRVIFIKRYYFGMSVSDIAADLDLSENAVSTRLLRIKERLYKYLCEREMMNR